MSTQSSIVTAVSRRGYISGYTEQELLARQLVKELEELCEAMQCLASRDKQLAKFLRHIKFVGGLARNIFDNPERLAGVLVDAGALLDELPDLVVPLAVVGEILDVPSIMELALEKANSDIDRGVRKQRGET